MKLWQRVKWKRRGWRDGGRDLARPLAGYMTKNSTSTHTQPATLNVGVWCALMLAHIVDRVAISRRLPNAARRMVFSGCNENLSSSRMAAAASGEL